jgi:hypothetical protein
LLRRGKGEEFLEVERLGDSLARRKRKKKD